MNTSKLLITSLLAAAAMSAVPAFAADYTVANGAIKDNGNKVASNGASGATINGEVNTTGVAVNAGDNFTFDNVTGYLPGWQNGTFAGNVVLTGGGLTISDGLGRGYTFFSGSVSGNGNFIVDADNNPAKGQDFIFTGNLTAFTGSFLRPVANYTAGKENAYNELDAGILQFGGTVSSNGIGAGTAYVASATADANGVVHNISGQGSITTTSVLRYNYTGSANAGVTALGIDNSSISARYVDFRGGANYTVSSTLTGNNTTASNNTLTISAGTTTFTGSIANFGTITVASGATADFSNTTFKLGAVSADSVTTTISNSGTVTFGAGTVFDINSYVEGAQLLGGVSTTQTFTIANLSIDGYLVNQRGSAAFSVSESGVLTLDSYAEGTNYSLNWNGGDSGVWKANGTGWTTTETTGEVTFQNGDSVTFGTGTENNATIAENLKVGTMTVSAATSLTGTGTIRVDAANLTTTAALTLGEKVILDLGSISAATTKTISGTGTVKVATGSNFKGVSLGAGFTGTIEHSGNIDASTFSSNPNAKYVLSSGKMWGGTTAYDISNDIHFENYQIGNTGTTKVNFTGALTQAEGTTLTIGGNANTTATFSGTANLSRVTLSAGTLTISGDGAKSITTLTQSAGTLNIGGAATITTLNVTGGTKMTLSGTSVSIGTLEAKSASTINIGTGSGDTKVVAVGRFDVGDYSGSNTNALNIKSDAVLKVTGTSNTYSGEYNSLSLMFGEWKGKTVLNLEGKLLATGAKLNVGDVGADLNVKSGAVLAVKGIGLATTKVGETQAIDLNIADNGRLILGASGIGTDAIKGWTSSIGAGTIGTSSSTGTTIETSLTLTSATGTTFDTQLWNFAADGNDIARSADTASSITVNGVISDATNATGALKKTGAGTLTLRGANTYTGGTVIEAGTVVAGSASALGTTRGVEVKNGATLNLGTSAVTVFGLSGAGTVGLAEGTTSSTLTVTGGGVFSGRLNRGENSLALVFDAGGQTLELNPTMPNSLSSVEIKAGTVKTGDAFGLGGSRVSVQSAGALEFTASKTNDYGLAAWGGITFAAGSSFVVDVTGAAENDVLAIITSSVIRYNNGTQDVSLTSDNLDSFVNGFVRLEGWDGLADWSYVDNVLSVTLTIPEPSVFGLLAGLGALALAGTRRRRKKA